MVVRGRAACAEFRSLSDLEIMMAVIAAVKRTASFEQLFSASIIVIIRPSSPQLFNFVPGAHSAQKMDSFVVNRALLNPKFEGYRLEAIPQEQAVSRYALSRKPTQATASGRLPLLFEEMRSRITHNHLAVDAESGQAAYVDQDYNVCLVGIPAAEGTPSFRILYEMAMPVDTSGAVTVQREYPSSVFLSATAVAVTDGNGLLYVLPIREGTTSYAIGTFTLRTGGAVDAPFRIHYAHRLSPITAVLLLSSRFYPVEQRKLPSVSGSSQDVQFDIWAVKIDLLSLRPGTETRQLEVLWHRRGQDVPIYATFIEEIRTYLIVSGSTYPDENATKMAPYNPTPDEIAPIPRYGENFDSKPDNLNDDPPKPHPYSWIQTPDSVTVAFPLPASTSKTQMKVIFTTQTLTLHIDAVQSRENQPVPAPHYSVKALWDSVNPSSCFWTWDREAEHAYGILTLHMEKRNEGTRWMQVFAASASSTAEDTENPEVPETVDPSELWHIRESLEKYTSALRTGEDASGLGLGRGVPNLMEGEMDEDADATVGRNVYATWIGEVGQTPEWTPKKSQSPNEKDWEEESMTLLSTPLPGSVAGSSDISLVLKNDLDGPVFSLSLPSTPSMQPFWKHTSTYSALAFVLASKQDTRFIYHLPGRGALAFEGGSLRDRGANVYVYRPQQAKDIWAKQSVLQVDDGSSGALLGIGCVKVQGGKEGDVVLDDEELSTKTSSKACLIDYDFEMEDDLAKMI
ncbi:hypothetical protein NLJ89_g5229 [Agrocybe chaxingu]|uniref:NudC domain-containing protein 1 n=1 Tax=Agrocybe chaxingu TaxID=84603 RepID=A0A9W8MX30_9AGAR|nr:hypothetical protein NLJ89_g5229 [Agrocybe chaxingu]